MSSTTLVGIIVSMIIALTLLCAFNGLLELEILLIVVLVVCCSIRATRRHKGDALLYAKLGSGFGLLIGCSIGPIYVLSFPSAGKWNSQALLMTTVVFLAIGNIAATALFLGKKLLGGRKYHSSLGEATGTPEGSEDTSKTTGGKV
jgi:hypothetical protein